MATTLAYRTALEWMGHSSSDVLNLYYHLHDEDSQAAMKALAEDTWEVNQNVQQDFPVEGALRATGQSTIEKTPQALEITELVASLNVMAERQGLPPAIFSKSLACAAL